MYQVKLFYGYEESESGIYHAFKATDPNVNTDAEEIGRELAEQLDRDIEDDCFGCRSMYVNLPETLVTKIKADAVREYLEQAPQR